MWVTKNDFIILSKGKHQSVQDYYERFGCASASMSCSQANHRQHRHVTRSVDVMKVNNIPFFMTISKHIKFGSAGKLDTMDDKNDSETF